VSRFSVFSIQFSVDSAIWIEEVGITHDERRTAGMIRFLQVTFFVMALALGLAVMPGKAQQERTLVVGGKNFNEGYLLSEIMAQTLEAHGFRVQRKFGLGGTLVCFTALVSGELDAYPEYTGTIAKAIFKLEQRVPADSLRRLLATRHGIRMLPGFGFNNTYVLAMQRKKAQQLGIRRMSDLRQHPGLKLGFSSEFLNRPDGWIGLQRVYSLPQRPRGMEHGLAYIAIENGEIDCTDAYSTDGDIAKYDLLLLEDDRRFFPEYLAVPLVRADLPEAAVQALRQLAGKIDAPAMQRLNAQVIVDGRSFAAVAADFLRETGLVQGRERARDSAWALLWRRTLVHIELTVVALLASMLVAIPTGILVFRRRRLARLVTYASGLLQTIPSIALLAFMIPLFGIGPVPAIVALFLYALLPILRNTVIALFSVDPLLKKVAVGMGMTTWQKLRFVELPLAMPTILAGIRTAAVINIGTATLAAFIGAGGLGEPIVTGLALNDPHLILQGAIPAALLAILVEVLFEIVEKLAIPAHLSR